jgi:hypothetical protein
MRHQRVNEDWIRFTPMKALNRSHHGLAHCASAREIRRKVPAMSRIL